MTDIVDKKTRSRMMAKIRGKDTKPEMLVRRFLYSQGIGYRLHDRNLPGSPDLVLSRHHLVIFVHGCFWHRHQNCEFCYVPKSNTDKWLTKFDTNIQRDQKQIDQLISIGWRVLVLWECGLKLPRPDLLWIPDFIKYRTYEYLEWPSKSIS